MEFIENYSSFALTSLIMIALSVFIINKVIKNSVVSTIIVTLKFSIFLIYFLFFSEIYPVILSDDLNYYYDSIDLYLNADQSLSYLFSPDTLTKFMVTAGGYHFGYYVYNFIAFWLCGPYYYSPVVINIFMSVLTAGILYKTIRLSNFNPKSATFLYIFFLLHWDVLSWSSFINLKDTFVLFLLVSAIYAMVSIKVHGIRTKYILYFILTLIVLFTIRFYFSFFLITTAIIFFAITKLSKNKYRYLDSILKFSLFVLIPISFYFTFISLFSQKLDDIGARTNIISGFLRYIVTPFPFNIEPGYYFIFISSLLHWICLPLLPFGLYLFTKKHFYTLMPYIIMFLLLSTFYGSFAELQGPRHRVPQTAILSLLQGLAIYEILASIKRQKSSPHL